MIRSIASDMLGTFQNDGILRESAGACTHPAAGITWHYEYSISP